MEEKGQIWIIYIGKTEQGQIDRHAIIVRWQEKNFRGESCLRNLSKSTNKWLIDAARLLELQKKRNEEKFDLCHSRTHRNFYDPSRLVSVNE